MPPKPERSSDASGRDATATDHTDAHATVSSSAFARAPSYSPAELAGFRDFAKVMRDAIGEKGSFTELKPKEAAERGCFGTLQSLHRRGRVTFHEDLCQHTAYGGQLKVLKWLRENSCPWNESTCAAACAAAAMGGHLGVLKWLRENNLPWSAATCAAAARCGQLHMLQWLRANGCPWELNTCKYAAEGGHLQVLQWARTNGCPWDKTTSESARDGGHPAVLKWLRENGCPGCAETCAPTAVSVHGGGKTPLYTAAEKGHETAGAEVNKKRLRTARRRCSRPLKRATRQWCGR